MRGQQFFVKRTMYVLPGIVYAQYGENARTGIITSMRQDIAKPTARNRPRTNTSAVSMRNAKQNTRCRFPRIVAVMYSVVRPCRVRANL